MKPLILDFLTSLEDNNNRDWFQQNKKTYEQAKKELETFVNSIIPELAKFDDESDTLLKSKLPQTYKEILGLVWDGI